MSGSVSKAFKILSYISNNQGQKTLSQMGRDLNINKTTLFRYIQTLESVQAIEKKDNFYFLGLRMFELGSKVLMKKMLKDKIHGILDNLCKRLNETVNLAQIHNSEVLYLDKIESNRSLQTQTSVGGTAPIHCTALGKAILSILPIQMSNKILKNMVLNKRTNFTITNKKDLVIQVEEIKRKGYSIDQEELEEGLKCIAVPFFVEDLNFYGGISLSGPSIRFTDETIEEYVKYLNETRDQIVKELTS